MKRLELILQQPCSVQEVWSSVLLLVQGFVWSDSGFVLGKATGSSPSAGAPSCPRSWAGPWSRLWWEMCWSRDPLLRLLSEASFGSLQYRGNSWGLAVLEPLWCCVEYLSLTEGCLW